MKVMKRIILLLFATLVVSGCENTDLFMLTDAATDAVRAFTLTDEDVQKLALEAARASDSAHRVAPPGSKYDKRLQRLVKDYQTWDDHRFNFKVYLTDEVNAFAMADGTVRIYSGLMDLMSDEELLFVIGHEIGHVVEDHSREKVVMAFGSSALRKALASQNNEIGQIARSVVGAFAHQLTNAQFSQYEERQADQYGVGFLENAGHEREAAVLALKKLEVLARQHTFLSSHPDPGKRAESIRKGDFEEEEQSGSMITTIFSFAKQLVLMVINIVTTLVSWLLSLW